MAPDGLQQCGPFETVVQTRTDRDRPRDESVNEAEAERQAEQEFGVEAAVHERIATPRDGDEMPEGVEGHER